jgi:predicted DsbA family dithiol-disulfide isomerase
MTDAMPLRIDIVSDVVCPWCIVGYKQVEKALIQIDGDIAVETWWHPFELNPNMPPEGENTAEHIARKYGSTPEQSSTNRQRLTQIGESVGFAFNYTTDMRIYNTFKAHKMLTITANERGWKAQTALKLALFKAYFQDKLDVGDDNVLLDIAEAQGLDRSAIAAWIADDALTQAVRAEQRQWMEQNITGVPAIIFDQSFMVPGAQSAETFADVIRKVLAKRKVA